VAQRGVFFAQRGGKKNNVSAFVKAVKAKV
jgi:hypothetical protein